MELYLTFGVIRDWDTAEKAFTPQRCIAEAHWGCHLFHYHILHALYQTAHTRSGRVITFHSLFQPRSPSTPHPTPS